MSEKDTPAESEKLYTTKELLNYLNTTLPRPIPLTSLNYHLSSRGIAPDATAPFRRTSLYSWGKVTLIREMIANHQNRRDSIVKRQRRLVGRRAGAAPSNKIDHIESFRIYTHRNIPFTVRARWKQSQTTLNVLIKSANEGRLHFIRFNGTTADEAEEQICTLHREIKERILADDPKYVVSPKDRTDEQAALADVIAGRATINQARDNQGLPPIAA